MVLPGSAGDTVDRTQLARVRDDVGERTLRRYAGVYLGLLDGRIDRIDRVAVGRTADGIRAALDLHTSSDMLGAKRLAALTADVVTLLRSGEPISARRMAALRTEAAAVAAGLPQALDFLDRPGPGAQESSGPPNL